MSHQADIFAIQLTLKVGGEHSLFIMATSDGSLSRMGTGSATNTEFDLFVGKTDRIYFQQLQEAVTSEVLAFCGRRLADPAPKGKVCELTIGVKRADGSEIFTEWRYGTESQGPPGAVCHVVSTAVEASEEWFEEQKLLARKIG